MKGRQIDWFQTKGFELMIQDISGSMSDELVVSLEAMPLESRSKIVRLHTVLNESIVDGLTSKFSFHFNSPYTCVQSFQGEVPDGDVEKAREVTRANPSEYDKLIAEGKGRFLHRVAHRLYSPGQCRQELEAFAAGFGQSLRSFSVAYCYIMQYVLIPLVGRRVESTHHEIKTLALQAHNVQSPWISAGVANKRHLKTLQDCPAFKTFVLQHWRSTSLLDSVLRLVVPANELRDMTRLSKINRIYQCGVENEFRPVDEQRQAHREWLQNTSHMR